MQVWRTTVIALILSGALVACDDSAKGTDGPAPSGPAPAASASGAPALEEDIGEVLAEVNGTAVGSKAFEQAASRKAAAEGDTLSLEEKTEVLDRLIDEELLYQEALRQGLDRDPKVKKVMVNSLMRQAVYGSIRNSDFTDEELQAYYDAHKDDFIVPAKVQIRRILIKSSSELPEAEAKSKAEGLRSQLVADSSLFKELATEHSQDPYRRRGGDVGFVPKTGKPGLDQEIVDKAFEMEIDQISEVFQTQEGFNIIMVVNKRDRVERTYQQMKGSVLRKVKNEKVAEMLKQYNAQLREKATVEVNTAKLESMEIKNERRDGPSALAPGAGLTPPTLPGMEKGGNKAGAEGGGE